ERNRNRRAGCDHRRSESGRARAKVILSARSCEYERLHHRRKYRDQCGWAALFEIRRHSQLCDRSGSRARQRRYFTDRRTGAQKDLGKAGVPAGNAHLLIDLDGQEESVRSEAEAIRQLLADKRPNTLEMATGEEDCEKLWELRRQFSNSLRATGLTKLNQDVVVPRSHIVDLIEFAERLHAKYGFPIACFGHAGDGNIHINIMADRYNR